MTATKAIFTGSLLAGAAAMAFLALDNATHWAAAETTPPEAHPQTQSAATPFQGKIGKDIRHSEPSYSKRPKPAANAPNVVIILVDDLGYADLGAYGSEIQTPNIDRLAAGGLRYSHFTATAICSPSRAALLTGLNHHSAGLGWLAAFDMGYPGYRGALSQNAITLAEILKDDGYATLMVGKWHLSPSSDESRAGPFDTWPTHRGFDRFWGFLSGETSQWYPHELVDGTTVIETPTDGSFYLPDALTDHAIEMIRDERLARPNQPFFLYYATGAPHAPHHVKPEDRKKYQGRYDEGWDKIREERLDRQIKMGLVPAVTKLSAYGPEVPQTWNQLTDDQKKMYARFQENYAGFVDNIDQNVGRLLAYLEKIGELDNTIFIVTSDNGASREVGYEGSTNVWGHFYHFQPSTNAENLKDYDKVGSWQTHPHYPRGWMQASNTPFINGKRTTFGGGVNVPLIITWADGIKARGDIRPQFHHINDITPTILDLLHLNHPDTYHGRNAKPMEGVSMVYSFDDATAPDPKTEQYYEIEGQRAYYAEGWKIVSWRPDGKKFDEVPWQLYNLKEDFSETHDLAAQYPDKVKELEQKWWIAARKYNVLPVFDLPLLQLATLASPSEISQRTHFELYPTDHPLPSLLQPRLMKRPYVITAEIERSKDTEGGVIVARGDYYAGWTFYIEDNHLIYENNLPNLGARIVSTDPLPAGAATVKYEFTPDQDPRALSGTGRLFVNGQLEGEGRIGRQIFNAWEGLEVGRDSLTPVSRTYDAPNPFQGDLAKVTFDIEIPAANPDRTPGSGD